MKKFFVFSFLFLIMIGFWSCYTPSPLYGTWTDNNADKIVFRQDGTFAATIVDSENTPISYEGNYVVIDNVLTFNIMGDSSYSRVTEWDIRGAILYLNWTTNNQTKSLQLYHTAR